MKTEQDVPEWTLVEELRIGSRDDPEQSLTDPLVDVVVGPGGDVFIPQAGAGEIRQYDLSGRFVRRIGRRGNGPGEFGMLWTIGRLTDTIYAINLNPGRVSLFSLDGTHLSTTGLEHEPLHELETPSPPSVLLPDGTALLLVERSQALRSGDPVTLLLRIDRGGKVLSTLLSHATPMGVAIPLGGAGTYHTARPLPDQPLAAVAPDGSRLAILTRYAARDNGTAEFRVTETTLSGDTLSSVGYEYRPVAVPREVADSLMAHPVRTAARILGSEAAAQRAVARELHLPAYYPPVTSIRIGDDSTLWLEREPLPDLPRLWEVYRDGRKIARIATPTVARVSLVQRDALWSVEHDELDVPYVVVTGFTGIRTDRFPCLGSRRHRATFLRAYLA